MFDPESDYRLRDKVRDADFRHIPGPRRFFKTVAGPGMTAYPTEGSAPTVYYARMLRNVSFPKSVGAQSLTYSLTDIYDYVFNLEVAKYIEVGAVVLCFGENNRWFTIDKVIQDEPFVVAMSRSTAGSAPFGVFVTAADMNGNQLWTYTLTSEPSSGGGHVAVDSHGNVYCFFKFDNATGDGYVTSLTRNGVLRWSVKVGETVSTNDRVGAIDIDADDNIFVALVDTATSPLNSGVYLDTNGNILWDFATQTGGYTIVSVPPPMVRFVGIADFWIARQIRNPPGTSTVDARRFLADGTTPDFTSASSLNFDVNGDVMYVPVDALSGSSAFLLTRDTALETTKWQATPNTTISSSSLLARQCRHHAGKVYVPFNAVLGGGGFAGNRYNFMALSDLGGSFSMDYVTQAANSTDHLYACDANNSGVFAGGQRGRLQKMGSTTPVWNLLLPGNAPVCWGVAVYPNRWN